MTETVDDLMRMTLNKPVRISVDTLMETNKALVQEFVKIPRARESDRPAILLGMPRGCHSLLCLTSSSTMYTYIQITRDRFFFSEGIGP